MKKNQMTHPHVVLLGQWCDLLILIIIYVVLQENDGRGIITISALGCCLAQLHKPVHSTAWHSMTE